MVRIGSEYLIVERPRLRVVARGMVRGCLRKRLVRGSGHRDVDSAWSASGLSGRRREVTHRHCAQTLLSSMRVQGGWAATRFYHPDDTSSSCQPWMHPPTIQSTATRRLLRRLSPAPRPKHAVFKGNIRPCYASRD